MTPPLLTRLARRALLATGALALCGATWAQKFPDRPIKLLVPFAVGGGTDILAREISPKLGELLGQPMVVENKGGAGGNIGSDLVAKSPADGYTILFGSNTLSINQALYKTLPFDPVKSFAPIGLVATAPLVLVVNPAIQVHSVQELIALAKAKPAALNWSAPGNGTPHHLASELFNKMTGVKITHVQYKGAGPAMSDVVAGHTQAAILTLSSAKPFIDSGKLRILAVAAAKRSPLLPEVPTVAESGVPGYEVELWYGLFAPQGTPSAVVQTLNAALTKSLQDKVAQARFASQGYVLRPGTPDELRTLLAADLERSIGVVQEANLKPE